jgi:hypothetical protein
LQIYKYYSSFCLNWLILSEFISLFSDWVKRYADNPNGPYNRWDEEGITFAKFYKINTLKAKKEILLPKEKFV